MQDNKCYFFVVYLKGALSGNDTKRAVSIFDRKGNVVGTDKVRVKCFHSFSKLSQLFYSSQQKFGKMFSISFSERKKGKSLYFIQLSN